jgi:hypothetical protein
MSIKKYMTLFLYPALFALHFGVASPFDLPTLSRYIHRFVVGHVNFNEISTEKKRYFLNQPICSALKVASPFYLSGVSRDIAAMFKFY